MNIFSPKIRNFLTKIGRIDKMYWAPVPKSASCGKVGDFLIFRYQLGTGKGSQAQRVVMIARPVIKCPKTGNLLLSAIKVDYPSISNVDRLRNLYKEGYEFAFSSEFSSTNEYRTYRLNKMIGPLLRLEVGKE